MKHRDLPCTADHLGARPSRHRATLCATRASRDRRATRHIPSRRLRVRRLLSISTLLVASASCQPDGCSGDGGLAPVLSQYHDGAQTAWQELYFFQNACQPMMCDPWDPLCPGAPYNEEFEVNSQGSDRDRYMFFEACKEGCSESPYFAPPGTYRVGGRYRSVTMRGRSARLAPFAPYGQVGHVRYYERGACSYEIPDLTELLDRLITQIREFILKDSHIYGVSVNSRSLRTVLGSPDCDQQQDYLAEHHDYVNVRFRLRVKPRTAGYWYHDIDAWWRFIAHPRSKRLFCSDTPQTDVTTRCLSDPDCWNEPYSDPYRDYCSGGWCRRECGPHQIRGCGGLPNATQCGRGTDLRPYCSARPSCLTDADCAQYPGAYCARPASASADDYSRFCYIPCFRDADCPAFFGDPAPRCGREPVQYCILPSGCHTLSCDPSYDECATWIPGSECKYTQEGYVCQKRHFLDVADYGIRNSFERHCQGDVAFCKTIYNRYKKKVNDYTKDLYPLLAQVIHEMYETTWQEMPDANGDPISCADWEDPLLPCNIIATGGHIQNFELRCGPETGKCEARPFYVYGVNMYPAAMEVILAPSDDANQYPEYTGLQRGGLCNPDAEGSSAIWSPVGFSWWQ